IAEEGARVRLVALDRPRLDAALREPGDPGGELLEVIYAEPDVRRRRGDRVSLDEHEQRARAPQESPALDEPELLDVPAPKSRRVGGREVYVVERERPGHAAMVPMKRRGRHALDDSKCDNP